VENHAFLKLNNDNNLIVQRVGFAKLVSDFECELPRAMDMKRTTHCLAPLILLLLTPLEFFLWGYEKH
jgi:hypothetical protein